MSVLLNHPLWVLAVWGLFALAFGVAIGKAIARVDSDEPADATDLIPFDDSTRLIVWDERPAAWR